MYKIAYTIKFKKDLRKLKKSGNFNEEKVKNVIKILATGEFLSSKYRDHPLKGKFSDMRECHIEPDLLLIYKIIDEIMVLYIIRIGSHSELL